MPSNISSSSAPLSLNTKFSTTSSNATTKPTTSSSSSPSSSLSPLSTWLLQFHPYFHRLRQTVIHTLQTGSTSSIPSFPFSSSSSSFMTWVNSLQTHPTLMSLSRHLGVPSWFLFITLVSFSARMMYKAPRVWFMLYLLPWKSLDPNPPTEAAISSSSSNLALKSFALTACVSHGFVHPKRWSTWFFWLSWWYLSKKNRNTTWIEWQWKVTDFLWHQCQSLMPFLFLDLNTSNLSFLSNSKQSMGPVTLSSSSSSVQSSLGKDKRQGYEAALKPTSFASNSFQSDLFELEEKFGEHRVEKEGKKEIQLDQQKQSKRFSSMS